MSPLALGVDIGGTKILTGLVAADGTVTHRCQLPTPAQDGPDAIIATVLAAARVSLQGASETVVGCGVGTAGVVDRDGNIASATDLLRSWAGTRLRERFAAAMGLEVTVLNDVHATALCEARLGAARGRDSTLVVAVGTGIGGALILNGELVPGVHGIAGSLGHMPAPLRQGRACSCGALDHVEAYSSGPALEAEYLRHTGVARDLRTIGVADEPQARAVIREGAEALGAVIGGANNLLDADIVVVGGGVAALGEAFFAPVREAASREALGATGSTWIVPAQFGADACLIGAGLAALARR